MILKSGTINWEPIPKFDFDLQFFGGKGGGSSSSEQYRKRDPEPQELIDLRQGIFNKTFPNLESYDPGRWTGAQDTADTALQKQMDVLGNAANYVSEGNEKSNGIVDKMLGVADRMPGVLDEMLDVTRGTPNNAMNNLRQSMGNSVNRGLQSGMGEMLNNLGGARCAEQLHHGSGDKPPGSAGSQRPGGQRAEYL
jgi:hypothetical protein